MTIPTDPDIRPRRPARTRLNPAVRLLWRAADSLQFELGARSVIVDGVPHEELVQLLGVEAPAGAPQPGWERTLAHLMDTGFLYPEDGEDPSVRARLAPELSALRIRHPRAAARMLNGRRQARVVVAGDGRVGAALGGLLAAAGVGHVHVAGTGAVRLRAAMPGGFAVEDEGRDFEGACADVLRRAAPEVRTSAPTTNEAVDLVILTSNGPIEEDVRELLHHDAQAHLVARCSGDQLVVGPLVLPGLTSCLGCADRHRLERDPAWTSLAVQLSAATKYPPPSDVALVSLAASVAALHVLAYLDGDEPASLNGTVELELPDWRLRRRTWDRHPDCSCAAAI